MDSSRARKPPHTAAERTELAERLRASHRPGMPVATWLRYHHVELTALTKGPRSWSWAELAEVLNLTPIRYKARQAEGEVSPGAGRWTEALLKTKVQNARNAERAHAAARLPQTIEEVAKAAALAAVEAVLAKGEAAGAHLPSRSLRAAVQQIAAPPPSSPPPPRPEDAPHPTPRQVRVYGAPEPESPKELTPLQRMHEEKLARTRRIIAEWQEEGRKSGDDGE